VISKYCSTPNPSRGTTHIPALSDIGFTVLRFSSWEVLKNIDEVSIILVGWIGENALVKPQGHRQRNRDK